MDDVGVAELDEVLNRERGAALVVGGDRVGPRIVTAGRHHHGWHHRRRSDDVVVVELGADEDQCLDLELQMGFDGPPLPFGVAPAVEDQHVEAVVVGGGLDSVHDLGEEGVVDVVDDHAQGFGAGLGEVAGVEVRPVSELLCCVQHRLALGLADLRRVVHHEAHEGARNAGTFGHGLHRRTTHRRFPPAKALRTVVGLDKYGGHRKI